VLVLRTPSIKGQQRLARVTWAATFDFTDQIPPSSTATTAPVECGTQVSIDAIDNVGVAGVEYRLDLGVEDALRLMSPIIDLAKKVAQGQRMYLLTEY